MNSAATESKRRSTDKNRAIRVLIAKPGLDGHSRGVNVIIRTLWEAGMEVIYTGMRVSPNAVVQAALQEDVDALGLSNHSGAHRPLFEAVVDGLREAGLGAEDIVLFCGGAIPPADVAPLRDLGFRGVFPPGSTLESIVDFLRREVSPR